MNRTVVQSSNVRSVGYDPSNKILEVEFKNGGIFHYHEVGENKHRELMSATSIGSYLHKNIKNRNDHKVTRHA